MDPVDGAGGVTTHVCCACAMRDAVQTLGIEIRAGLHTGEYGLSSNDIDGIAVHIGARVMAQAGAGEVWVSSTVKDLVAGSGIAFEDRGTHSLKGVTGEWRLFRVMSDVGGSVQEAARDSLHKSRPCHDLISSPAGRVLRMEYHAGNSGSVFLFTGSAERRENGSFPKF